MKKNLKVYAAVFAAAGMLVACQGKTEPVETTTVVETEATTAETTEAETTEAETTKAEESSQPKEASGVLSDDIYSFQAEINGELYTFPMSMEEFSSHGWEMIEDGKRELEPNQYSVAERFRIKRLEMYAVVYNLGQDTIPMEQSAIGGVSIDFYQVKDNEFTMKLPKGIEYGVSSAEDVIAAYGEPSHRYDGSMSTTLTYTYDYHREVKIGVDNETKVINDIEIQNVIPLEDAAQTNGADTAPVEKSAEVSAYTAPSELGTDIRSFHVEYAGSLYTLPAPVSVFVENGWTIQEDKSNMTVAGKDAGWVTLKKDNQSLRTMVKNYGKNGDTIYNCFVTDVKSAEYGPNIPITLPGNITLGMSKEDLLSAIADQDYTIGESGSVSTAYLVEAYDYRLNRAEIYVNNETNKVNSISYSNTPKELK